MASNNNQEFNKSIKQLQSMVRDKMFISLAEKFYNLKQEMNNLMRAVKDKETKLLVETKKAIEPKNVEEKVEAVSPAVSKIDNGEQTKPQQQKVETKPNASSQNRDNRNQFNPQANKQNNKFDKRPNQQGGKPNFNSQSRPYQGQNRNPNFKQNQNQKPNQNNKRPQINYAQPIITASPTRNFGNKKKETEHYEEKRGYTKRDLIKRGMITDEIDEDRIINRKVRTKKKETQSVAVEKPTGPAIITTDNITIKLLSEVSGKPVSEIIKKFMILGMMVTINSTIDFATA